MDSVQTPKITKRGTQVINFQTLKRPHEAKNNCKANKKKRDQEMPPPPRNALRVR